jgi:hypothetical protein
MFLIYWFILNNKKQCFLNAKLKLRLLTKSKMMLKSYTKTGRTPILLLLFPTFNCKYVSSTFIKTNLIKNRKNGAYLAEICSLILFISCLSMATVLSKSSFANLGSGIWLLIKLVNFQISVISETGIM